MKNIYLLLILVLIFNIKLNANIHIGTGQQYENIEAACPFIKPGDTVFVHKGNYDKYQYYSGLKGTQIKNIYFRPFSDEEIEIGGGWQFTSSEYLRFEKLNFRGNSNYNGTLLHFDHGGDCNKLSNNIVLDSCSFSDVSTGNTIKFGGVANFWVSNCSFINNTSGAAGIAINESRNGSIYRCYFENIKTKAIQFKLGAMDMFVQANYFLNAGMEDAALKIGESGGKDFYCPDANQFHAKNIKVYSNIFIGGRTPFSIGLAENTEVINNTIIKPNNFVFRILSDEDEYFSRNHSIINNIFYLDKTFYINATSSAKNIEYWTIKVQDNLFYSVSQPNWKGPDPSGGEYDAEEINGVYFENNLNADPKFIDLENNNFKLKDNSPALWRGFMVNNPRSDFRGRPFKENRALGAIESDTVINVTNLSLYPKYSKNKVGDKITLYTFVEPIDADNQNIKWTSSDTALAKVDNYGEVSTLKRGNVTITATTEDGGYSDSCNIEISNVMNLENETVLAIFPNPTSDFINIFSEDYNSKIEIFNHLGETVLTTENNSQIYVGDLIRGVYYLRLGNKTQMFVRN